MSQQDALYNEYNSQKETGNAILDGAYVPETNTPDTEWNDDNQADPEGAERRAQPQASRTDTPSYVLDDFDWRERTDHQTGEVTYYMVAKPQAVNRAMASAPARRAAAFGRLGDEDHATIKTLTGELTSLSQTLSVLDDYARTALIKLFAEQAARGFVRVARWVDQINGAMSRIPEDKPTPDWVMNIQSIAKDASRRAAIYDQVVKNVEPSTELNFKGAAWDVMRAEAYKNQQRFNDPAAAKRNAENDQNATNALTADL